MSANSGFVGVQHLAFGIFFTCRIFLFLGEEKFGVGFVVPPHEAGITVHNSCARMHMAHNTLAGRNTHGKLMFNRVARFATGNHRISLKRGTLIPKNSERAGIHRRSVVGINNVA